MTNVQFYTLTLPIDVVEEGTDQQQPQTARAGLLDSDTGAVEHVSTDPEQDQLTATIRGQYAEKIAQELEELASSSAHDPLPIFDERSGAKRDGYYSAEHVRSGPSARQIQEAYEVKLRVRQKGGHETHWRSIRTNVVDVSAENPFSATTEAPVAIPSQASKVRWAELSTKASQSVDDGELTTHTAEHADVDVADANAAPIGGATPTIAFELPFAREGRADCSVWDDRGESSKLDANSNVQWQKVFAAGHEFDGTALVENGLLRLTLDEANGVLEAEEWDDANSQWSSVDVEPAGWTLFDADVTEISQSRVAAQLFWTVPARYYTGDSFDVSSESDDPLALTWDGSSFWVIENTLNGATVYEYDSSGSYTGANFDVSSEDSSMWGIAWDGSSLWTAGYDTNTVYEYDTSGSYTGANFDVSSETTEPAPLVWDGSSFWVIGVDNYEVYEYDASGSYTGTSFDISSETFYPWGITWDGSSFWIVDVNIQTVFQYDSSGSFTGTSFPVDEDGTPNSIAWDGSSLWIPGADADVVFEYAQPDAREFALDCSLQRGLNDALFTVPPNQSGSIPSELESALAPIASDQTHDAQPAAGVLNREKLRK